MIFCSVVIVSLRCAGAGRFASPIVPAPRPGSRLTDGTGRPLLSRAAVSEITERLLAELETCASVTSPNTPSSVSFADGIAGRLRPGPCREAVLPAWGTGEDGRKSLLGSWEDLEAVRAFFGICAPRV